jgi:cytochrome c biogenesis protein CcmG/thiol:disulfide interchange protein DsbE
MFHLKGDVFFLNRLGNPFDFIVFDEQGKLGLELGVYATPETFIVDNKGVIQEAHTLTNDTWFFNLSCR